MAQNQLPAAQSLAEIADTQSRLNIELDLSGKLAQQFGKALTTAFIDVAAQGRSLADVVQSLGQKLSGLALNAAFKPLEDALAGLVGGVLQSTTGLPVPFTSGGVVTAMPALAFADQSLAAGGSSMGQAFSDFGGSVGSGSGLAGSVGASIVLNVTTPDVESFRRSETQLAAVLARVAAHGQRNL